VTIEIALGVPGYACRQTQGIGITPGQRHLSIGAGDTAEQFPASGGVGFIGNLYTQPTITSECAEQYCSGTTDFIESHRRFRVLTSCGPGDELVPQLADPFFHQPLFSACALR
jgi:hypothetical protein